MTTSLRWRVTDTFSPSAHQLVLKLPQLTEAYLTSAIFYFVSLARVWPTNQPRVAILKFCLHTHNEERDEKTV
jgi:hypothetical protein